MKCVSRLKDHDCVEEYGHRGPHHNPWIWWNEYVCMHCQLPIEFSDGTWWVKGTCGVACMGESGHGLHENNTWPIWGYKHTQPPTRGRARSEAAEAVFGSRDR